MDRLWESTELGFTPHIQRKLERQKIRYGDGVEKAERAGEREEWLERWLGGYAETA